MGLAITIAMILVMVGVVVEISSGSPRRRSAGFGMLAIGLVILAACALYGLATALWDALD